VVDEKVPEPIDRRNGAMEKTDPWNGPIFIITVIIGAVILIKVATRKGD
jgi:hypothetical protein